MMLAKRRILAAAFLVALIATPAFAGLNPDARLAIDMLTPDPGRTCASMHDAYPNCRAITPSMSSPGDFEAVIVVYNFAGITAAEFTLTWPEDWELTELSSCADLMIGGDIHSNPTRVSLAWSTTQIPAGGSAGIPVAIVRGRANSPGCLALVPPPEGVEPAVVDADFVIDPMVEWFGGCAGTVAGDPCAFDSLLVASFEALNPTGSAPLDVAFVDRSTGSPVSWQWTFGDGGTSAERNPHHVYTACGIYSVGLRVGNGTAFDDTVRTGLVQVDQATVPSFVASPVSGCSPLAVQFTDTSTGAPTTWHWDFGDGGSSTLQNPLHTYAAPGVYSVLLVVTGPCGSGSHYFASAIRVYTQGAVSFDASPRAGCSPLDVEFADLSSGTPYAWHWVFGDGVTSEEQFPSHRYETPGTYTVSLTVTNDCGTSSLAVPGMIRVGGTLDADFTGTPREGCYGLSVQFTGTASGDSVTLWHWAFGDGTEGIGRVVSHVYANPGLYSVTMTAVAACGSRAVSKGGYVHVFGAPGVDFIAEPSSGCAPLDVQFTWQGDPAVTAWLWNFGDGGTSTLRDPAHRYTRAGSFDVRLTATGPCSTVTYVRPAAVVVPGPPPSEQVGFTATPREFCAPAIVLFNDTSGVPATGWLWDFGDGATSTEQNPQHRYETRGTWPVTLTVQTSCGDASHTEPGFIRSDVPQQPVFWNPDSACVDDYVYFENRTPGGAVISWLWEFGDGGTSTERQPIHWYSDLGTYDVALTVVTECGTRRTLVPDAVVVVEWGSSLCHSPQPTQIQGPVAAIEAGGVVVRWTVIPPSDYTGYHVQRAIIAAGPYARVTVQPIPDLTRQGRRSYEFRDASAEAGATYYYRLEAIRPGAASEFFAFAIPVTMPGVMVREAWLGEPSPMPATTRLAVEVGVPPGESSLSVAVYDSRGRRVKVLAEGALATGVHRLEWNGADEGGRRMTAGVYFIRLETSGRSWTKKALLVR